MTESRGKSMPEFKIGGNTYERKKHALPQNCGLMVKALVDEGTCALYLVISFFALLDFPSLRLI